MNDYFVNEAGAFYMGNGKCFFRVWAPEKNKIMLHAGDQVVEMKKGDAGYYSISVNDIMPGTIYKYLLDDGNEYPDPASGFQSQGVHGPSVVVDHEKYTWHDNGWQGLPMEELILYEIHVGTFTEEGSFTAIIGLLDYLVDTGINAIELMPIGQFSGDRNWGYDGVYPYAVQNTYGGPDGLKSLVDACHQKGIAVFLDVIYNHLGPEGNYFSKFAPYFSDKYIMPWGDALNFDGAWSDGVKDYFSNNVIYWFDKFHIDGLRLDAIHTMYDDSAINFWEITRSKIRAFEKTSKRKFHIIAESDLNSPRVIKSSEQGGYGFDAQWLDDFHHALYTLLDPKGKDRYEDYGTMEQLAKAYTDGFVLSGDWVKFRKKKFGASSAGIAGNKFIVFNQNHDQVGNRVGGERLSKLIDFERLKVAAAAVLFSPYIPMLFMGEEFGEDNPFYFFVSHSEESLIAAVREGRKKEFSAFAGDGEFPDPQDVQTFNDSKIDWNKKNNGKYKILLDWHRELIAMRKKYPAFSDFDKQHMKVDIIGEKAFALIRKDICCLFNLSEASVIYQMLPGKYELLLHSKDKKWMEAKKPSGSALLNDAVGSLIPLSVSVYARK